MEEGKFTVEDQIVKARESKLKRNLIEVEGWW